MQKLPKQPLRGGAARLAVVWLFIAASIGLNGLTARRAAAQVSAEFIMRFYRFADGGMLPALHMHYRTLGTRRGNNAVLIMHGTTGSAAQFLGPVFAGELFGPGQLLDTSKYYVILTDDIGHGGSTKPSDGLHAHFPHYGYADMVQAKYRLVTEGLHLTHLRLMIGTSMGCMHSWMWAEAHPDFVDGYVPLACMPTQITGRNRIWRKMAMDDIRNDPAWRNGDYDAEPNGLTAAMGLLSIMATNALVLQRAGPTRDAADSAEAALLKTRLTGSDANDLLYQIDASRDYDPSGALERITAPVLAINFADDEINPPELGIEEQLMARVKHVKFVLVPASDQTRGHGTHTVAAVWKSYLADFIASLPPS